MPSNTRPESPGRVSLAFNLTPSREVWGSDKLDNERQPCVQIPGDLGYVLLGSKL